MVEMRVRAPVGLLALSLLVRLGVQEVEVPVPMGLVSSGRLGQLVQLVQQQAQVSVAMVQLGALVVLVAVGLLAELAELAVLVAQLPLQQGFRAVIELHPWQFCSRMKLLSF
jgi:hypothetical protein